jgi:hypothetical protein
VSHLKTSALKVLAAVYLLSLWVFQLPESGVEGFLNRAFRPVQKVMFTDRLYRMYAPDPRTVKRIPFLELETDRYPVRFFRPPYGFLSLEKWDNFMDSVAKAFEGDRFFLTNAEGRVVFHRLAERICREASVPEDRVLAVTLKSRRVEYGEFRGDIVWDEPITLESFECP